MGAIALTRASQLIQITDTLERLDRSAERMLERAKLPQWHLSDPDDLIPTEHIYQLMDTASRSLGCPTFGLQVGLHNSTANLGTFGRLVTDALTPYQSFEKSCRLLHLHSSFARNWMTGAGEEVWFCHSELRGPRAGRWQMEQYILMRLIEHVDVVCHSPWRPAKVALQTHSAPESELREELRDPQIRVGQKFTGIAVPWALLTRRLRRRAITGRETREEAEQRLLETAPAVDFVGALRQLIGTLLKEGSPQIETMAKIVGLSVRSLQRRLAANDRSYSQIIAEARYQAATRLLSNADIRITDIAFELDYSDSAHFTRAFKRWAGVTPREYRSYQRAN